MSVPAITAGTTRRIEVDGDVLEITPLGAGAEVGRSCCIVRFRGKVVMFDCGVHPAHSGMSCLPYFDHINPQEVDLLLVTHFHLDHSGAVPYFVSRTEFKGKVFMTHPTRPICKMLWQDYARERQFRGIKFSCFRAGHVLGAAMFMINIGGIRVLYTGDYSREEDRHLPQAEIPNVRIHVLIVESTYGVMNHEPRDSRQQRNANASGRGQREQRFTNSVHQIVRQGGKCLLPVFALGRAQEILLILEDYWERNSDLHEIPIFYNSPMATKCLRIFETYTNMCSLSANRCNNPWILKYIQNMPDRHTFAQLENEIGACVVLAAPGRAVTPHRVDGMLQSGASRELFESWAPEKKNGVILTGYSVGGTLAHELKGDPESVTLNDGRKVNVKATVKFMSFSAHSDCESARTSSRSSEERLLADALRLLHSSVTPSGVKRQVQDLLQQVMHHLTASPLQAARCARRTLERNSSSLAALWALEVVSLCSVNLWLLDREEREDLILQVRRMRSEGLWPEKAEEILRSFQEQDRLKVGEQLFEHRVSLPRCRSASSPFRPELAVLVPRPTTVATREPRAVVAPRTATRRDGLKERDGTEGSVCWSRRGPSFSARSHGSIRAALIQCRSCGGFSCRIDSKGSERRRPHRGLWHVGGRFHRCPSTDEARGLRRRALLEIYDEVEVSEGRLKVCEAVEVSLENQILCITWDSSPVNDMVADSVAFTAIEITRSPTMLTALQGDVKKEEDRIFQVLCTYMQQEFGRLKIDDSTQLVSFEVDGQAVLVNFPLRQVQAPNEALRERVTKALRRCERALRPIQAV
eukprot:g29413.t1